MVICRFITLVWMYLPFFSQLVVNNGINSLFLLTGDRRISELVPLWESLKFPGITALRSCSLRPDPEVGFGMGFSADFDPFFSDSVVRTHQLSVEKVVDFVEF